MDWLVDFVISSYYAVCIHLLGLFLAKYSLALTLVACVCQFHRIKETQIIYSKYGHILTKISIPLYSDTHLCMLIGCTSKWLLMRSTTIYWNYFWPIVILSIVNLVIFILNWFSFEYIYADVSYSPVSRNRNYLNIVNIVLYNCVTIRSINYSPKLDFKSIFGFSNAIFNTNTNLSIPLSKNPHSYQWQFGNFIEKILISITHFDLPIFPIEIIIIREKVQICDAFSSLGFKWLFIHFISMKLIKIVIYEHWKKKFKKIKIKHLLERIELRHEMSTLSNTTLIRKIFW